MRRASGDQAVKGWTTAAALTVVLLAGVTAVLPEAVLAHPSDDEPAAERTDPDYAAGKAALDAKDWGSAMRLLSSAAFKHYQRALQLNPRHRGAHEYIGEAYLMVNDLAKAEEHLAALEKICLIPCDEYEDLKKGIAEHRRRAR